MSKIDDFSQLDLNGVYSYADYLTWQFEQAVELIKGKILPMAAPSRKHQDVSTEVIGLLYTHFRGQSCRIYAAPFDVRLLDKKKSAKANKDVFTVVQPDICIICDKEKLDDKGCLGAPDLIIEILSPGNSKKEMKTKRLLYEENAVREYWIIDPEHETTHQFCLNENGLYHPPMIYVNDDVLNSAIFTELNVDLAEVFKAVNR